MTDILQLHGWEVSGIRLDAGEYIISATYTAKAGACVKCSVIGNLYRHGTFDYLESHHMRPLVGGEKDRNVYLCPSCHHRFHMEEVSHGNQLSTPFYE